MSNQPSNLTQTIELVKNKATNPFKRALYIEKLTSGNNLNKKELAYLINKSPSYISNYLRLLELPEVIKDALLSGILTEGHARALTFLNDKQEVIHLFEDIIRFNYSVRETEHKVDRLRKNKRQYGKVAEDLKEQIVAVGDKWGVDVKVNRRKMHFIIAFSFPLGIVGFRKLKSFLNRLLG